MVDVTRIELPKCMEQMLFYVASTKQNVIKLRYRRKCDGIKVWFFFVVTIYPLCAEKLSAV